jgi:hypothetical protein
VPLLKFSALSAFFLILVSVVLSVPLPKKYNIGVSPLKQLIPKIMPIFYFGYCYRSIPIMNLRCYEKSFFEECVQISVHTIACSAPVAGQCPTTACMDSAPFFSLLAPERSCPSMHQARRTQSPPTPAPGRSFVRPRSCTCRT